MRAVNLRCGRSAVTEGISLIVTYDTDIKTLVVDHPVAFQPTPAATIYTLHVRGAIRVGQSRGAHGFIEWERIESVDPLGCVISELTAFVSL